MTGARILLTLLLLCIPATAQTEGEATATEKQARKAVMEVDLMGLFRGGPDPYGYTPEDNSNVQLFMPHRTLGEINDWLTSVISETLTFEDKSFQKDINKTIKYFSASGRKGYIDFLHSTGMSQSVRSGKYSVNSFVEGQPLLLSEGPAQGRYRWVLNIPVTITYLTRSERASYKTAKPINRYMTIRVQIGRVKEKGDDMNLDIESWAGQTRRKN